MDTKKPSQPGDQSTVKLLALGDSYTIGEAVAENERWPNQLSTVLTSQGKTVVKPKIIATTGWRTDDLKRAVLGDGVKAGEYNYVSLLIGVNNQYQGKSADAYRPEFEELLKMAIDLASGDKSKVFVISIPDYGYTPFGQSKQEEISKAIDDFNDVNRQVAENYGITYVYITDLTRNGFTDPSLVATDGLHPSGKMYGLWVGRILSQVTF